MLAANSFGENRNSATDASPPPTQALSDAPRRLQDGSAFAAKPTQRLLDIRTATAEPQTVRPALNLIGRVIADPNRSSIVQSVYGGRVVPSESAIPAHRAAGQQGRRSRPDRTVSADRGPHDDPGKGRRDRATDSGRRKQDCGGCDRWRNEARCHKARSTISKANWKGLRARRETTAQFPHRTTKCCALRRMASSLSAKVVPGQVIQPQDVLFQIADPKRPLGRGFGLWRDRSERARRSNGGRDTADNRLRCPISEPAAH